jgi:hypothetical protein
VRTNAITLVVEDDGIETSEIPDPRSPDDGDALHATVDVEVMA